MMGVSTMAEGARQRDRGRTETRILDAVGALLVREGFTGLGVNAIAAQAGVDKVLIYRYFGGFDGLLEAYAGYADLWWRAEELIGDSLPPPARDSFADWVTLILARHVRALRDRPATRAVLVWELVERNPLTEALGRLRGERSFAVMAALVERLGHGGGSRAGPVVALLAAALQYLLVRSAVFDDWLGLDLSDRAGWVRLEGAVSEIARAVFPPEPPTPS